MQFYDRDVYLRLACDAAFTRACALGEGVRASALASEDPEVRGRIATVLSLRGDVDDVRLHLERCGDSPWEKGARAFAALTGGRIDEARALFRVASTGARKERVELPAYLAAFDLLLSVTAEDAVEAAVVSRRIDRAERQLAPLGGAYSSLRALASFRQSGVPVDSVDDDERTWIDAMFTALREAWTGEPGRAHARLTELADRARKAGYAWLGAELERIGHHQQAGSLLSAYQRKPGWEVALDALAAAAHEATTRAEQLPARPRSNARVWWTVTAHDVLPHLATKAATKGKPFSLRRAAIGDPSGLDAHDLKVAAAIERARHDPYETGTLASVVRELVGHPRVRDQHGKHLQVERGEPTLHVTKSREGAAVSMVPSHFDSDGVAVGRASPHRLVVYERTAVTSRLVDILAAGELHVPASGLGRLSQAVAALGSTLRVDAAPGLGRDGGLGDARLHVQLFRGASGLRARVRVVPGGERGPALRPGQPPAEIMIGKDDGLVRLTRDLAAETARYEALLARCPIFASLHCDGDDRLAPDLETCLELLLELRDAEDTVVEWPEGKALRAPMVDGGGKIEIHVRGAKGWLAVQGHLRIDESRVIEMSELLSSSSRAVGRFLPLGDDAYVALTDDVRSKLEALRRVSALGKDGQLPGVLLPALDGLLEGLPVTFEDALEEKREAFERAQRLQPETPRDLVADLRDYQRDGFAFLVRRTEAGFGACLADDMGLGKTVQALAVLLHRREHGPALVVAPTSVCRNWESEARRFAPSLAIHRLAGGDRAALVENAKSGDLVIVSYGLLASEAKLLARRSWGTIVYDEAHALKNASTRRWSAARDLQAGAVVALTGTPIENHAAELHALFELLVPGMLGPRSLFDETIGRAISEGDRDAAAILGHLVRPFVLRRTKTEVLTELPPKTELLHVVTPSEEHRAFYEAVRRRAAKTIDEARTAPRGTEARQKHMQALAEITRLRRAAIDPRLVGGEEAPEGSKLDALVDLALELREEKRRALVFSQFLGVLDMARERLEARGFECRRLDGTMTESARAAEVTAFQGGKGDVFLVSLKAGGVGLNLTAADVVVLLDPWWNPAVEDQASSRAHRMGQSRPVTVVRIVTEGTIEEKVLELHAKKRQLFDDVVTDADGGGTLDMDTLAMLLA